MKQCPNCHAWVYPNDTVCRYCGAALYATNNPIVQAKKFWDSTVFLFAIIIFSVYAAGEVGLFVYDLFFTDPIADLRNLYLTLKDWGLEISELSIFWRSGFDYVMPIYKSVRFLLLSLPLSTLSGLWIFYTSCKAKPESAPVKTFGSSFLKVEPIAKFFISAIALIGAVVLSIWFLIQSFASGNFSWLMLVSLSLAVVFLLVIGIFYDIGLWRTISAIQEKVSVGKTKKTVSIYVIICNIAYFVCYVLLMPANLLAAASSSIVSFLRFTALFMLALVLISYRSKIQNPPRQPVPAPMPVYPTGTPYYNLPQPQTPYGMPQYLVPVQQPAAPYAVQPMQQSYMQQPISAPQYGPPPAQASNVTPPPVAGYPNTQGSSVNNGQTQPPTNLIT